MSGMPAIPAKMRKIYQELVASLNDNDVAQGEQWYMGGSPLPEGNWAYERNETPEAQS